MKVLYLEGDPVGARFVSGTLTRLGVVHELVRPGGVLPRDLSTFQAAVVSNFPHSHLHELEDLLARAAIHGELGLLMLGGSKSFGRGGYGRSPLGELLPVVMLPGDDRCNAPGGILLDAVTSHPILRGCEWSRPLVVCGCNRIEARPHTTTAVIGRTLEASPDGVRPTAARHPVLVLKEAEFGRGRTAALAVDLAPRWGSALLGWGERTMPISEDDEVGEDYATFLMNLVRWVAGEEVIRRPLPSWEALSEIPPMEYMPSIRADDPSER